MRLVKLKFWKRNTRNKWTQFPEGIGRNFLTGMADWRGSKVIFPKTFSSFLLENVYENKNPMF